MNSHVPLAEMKTYLVDTNGLLDVIGADAQFGTGSKDCLVRCAGAGVLVINPVIYAEVGAVIETIEELEGLLPLSLFRRDPLPWKGGRLPRRPSVSPLSRSRRQSITGTRRFPDRRPCCDRRHDPDHTRSRLRHVFSGRH